MTKLLLLLAISCTTTTTTTKVTPSNTCPSTTVVNNTDTAWTEHDNNTLNYCKSRCKQIYRNSPCLKYFAKVGELSYHAICGR